jgi:peptidoglycan/LPS O-acetylase OafA/YrhL
MKPAIHSTIDYQNISTFKGLNSLRFIAAFLVLMHHSESIKKKSGLESFDWLGLFRNGGNAVTFFFVLSGFLITYLLLKENKQTGHVSIKNFYLKRVLRIWPLYFLLVLTGTVIIPIVFSVAHINYQMPYTLGETWYYFVFFLPGLVTLFFGHHLLEPLWSIGVEEVFYLIWAPLFKFCRKSILTLLISVIIIKLILRILCLHYIQNELFNYIVSTFQFEAMAIGGLGAYFIYTKGNLITRLKIFNIPSQLLIIFTLLTFLVFHSNIDFMLWNVIFKTPILSSIILDILFLYLIICVSVIDQSIINIESKTLSYLGEISYGIYMYHVLIIFTTLQLLKNQLLQLSSPWSHIAFYAIVSALTILTAALSKRIFEDYFLKMKTKLIR